MPADRRNRAADLTAIATVAGTSWQPAQGRFYAGGVLIYLVWDVGTSGMNAECNLRNSDEAKLDAKNARFRHWT